MRYLVAPSILAGVITFPLMTAIFDVVGIFGGYLVGGAAAGALEGTYFGEMQTFVDMGDIMTGFWKSISFGIIVTWVCTYKGFHVCARRRGRGAGDDAGRRAVLGADPRLGLLHGVSSAHERPMIKVSGLRKSFGGQPVLRGVDLEVPDGSITIIIGRSGGGKSVFLKHLIGLLRPDAGASWSTGWTSPGCAAGPWTRSASATASSSRAARSSTR